MNARTAGVLGLAGVLGWVGLVWLGTRMFLTDPPTAGFDLELLLRAGRNVAAGRSPYDPAMLAGTAPVAERLFYSYPPIVAQVLAVVAGVPSVAMFVAWIGAAVAGFVAVTVALGRRLAPDVPARSVAAVGVVLVPLLFPFAIGLLFGNLDVFFPTLYGLLLIGALPAATPRAAAGGGVAAAIASVAKLHPGSLGLWLLVRSASDRAAPGPRIALAGAIVAGLAILAVSVVLGPSLWADYASVIRAGSGADLVDPRNAGPAAQLALLLGGSGLDAERLARTLQIPVTIVALGVTALVAWRTRDPVESLAWAATASLVILPVTWYHYPSALLPFGAAALFRASAGGGAASGGAASGGAAIGGAARGDGRVRSLVIAAGVVAALAIAILPLLYVAVGLLLAAVRLSAGAPAGVVRVPAPG